MNKNVADMIRLVKDENIKFVDLRFTDTRGKEQHLSFPAAALDEDKFRNGHTFDGSSISGWKSIEESDMTLIPDANATYIDPFYEESTLVLRCDVVEPGSGLGYAAYFGPEPEFFIFDSVRWGVEMSGAFVRIDSEEASWSSGKKFEQGN